MIPGRLLIIDDNKDLLEFLRDFFRKNGFDVLLALTATDGIEKFRSFMPDLVITDMRLPDKAGNWVVKEVKSVNKKTPVIIITGYSDHHLIVEAMENGATELLKKPFKQKDLKYLLSKIEILLKRLHVDLSSQFVCWEKRHYEIENDIHVVPIVVDYLFDRVDYICENDSFLRIGLQEILINAIEHGNLEISYAEKQKMLDSGDYNQMLMERAKLDRFNEKKVELKVFSTPQYLKIMVEDMGNGFDLSALPNLGDPENFFKESGKGILMAVNAFDQVQYNDTGNVVTLLKYSEFSEKPTSFDGREQFDIFEKYTQYTKLKDEFELELNLAAEFQNTFLPDREKIKNFNGVYCDYIYIPLLKVSGDFVDISQLEENIYGFFISDISGHGVAAALISSMLKVFFSLYAKDVLSPQLLFEILNQEFYSYLNAGEYFTSFYGIYFQEEKRFVFTNANHPPPLLLRKGSKTLEPLSSEGFFVGVFKDSSYEEQEIFLEEGDRILFFTDGIIEAKNRNGEEFGLKRVTQIFLEEQGTYASDLIHIIKNSVNRFCENNVEDDITIAIMEIRA